MRPHTRSDRVVARRLQALARALPGAVEGDLTGVHKARVASRRIREALPIVLADVPRRRSRPIVRVFRELTRVLGPVRELDVALARVSDLQATHPEHAHALGLLRHDLETERQERRRQLLDTLEHLDLEQHVETIERALRPRADRRAAHAAATVLAARLARRGRSLRDAVDSAGALYAPEAVHAVRIALKKLRYALELAADLKLLSSRRPLAQLKAVQEILGELHDREVVLEWLRRFQARVLAQRPPDPDDLSAMAGVLEAECRELHAAYVGRRGRLAGIAEAALDALAPPAEEAEVSAAATVH